MNYDFGDQFILKKRIKKKLKKRQKNKTHPKLVKLSLSGALMGK